MGIADSPLKDRMIFAVGVRRSGTHWLQRVLNAHPDVVSVPAETLLFSHGINQVVDRIQHGLPTSPAVGTIYAEPTEFYDALRYLCDTLFQRVAQEINPLAPRIVERSSVHVEQLALIGSIYPDAHFVQIIRDGRDVSRSLVSRDWGPNTIEEAAEEWVRGVTRGHEAGLSLPHYTEIRYEELLADPSGQIASLFASLDLPGGDGVIETAVAEAGLRQNQDPKDPNVGVGKWERTWSPEDLAAFEAVAGTTMTEFGYAMPDRAAVSSPSSTPKVASAPATQQLRSMAGKARRAAGRIRSSAPPAVPTMTGKDMETGQMVTDRFFSFLWSGDYDAAVALLTDNVSVRVIGRGSDSSTYGEQGRRYLREALVEQFAGRGVPASEVIVCGNSFAVLLNGAGRPGTTIGDHVMLLTVRGEAIGRFIWRQTVAPVGASA